MNFDDNCVKNAKINIIPPEERPKLGPSGGIQETPPLISPDPVRKGGGFLEQNRLMLQSSKRLRL